jgi:serine/threonine protein kinase
MSFSPSHPDTFRQLPKDNTQTPAKLPCTLVPATDFYDIEAVPSASGGFARIFRARSKKTGQWKALKRLHPVHNQPLILASFQQEIQALKRLQHPSIVALQDFGEDEHGPYIVVDWVDGISLRQHLQQHGPLSPQQFCSLAIQICEGLEHAHANGVLHLDIKPDNILLDITRHVRIVDLGISRLICTGRSPDTLSSSDPVGTPGYASPEQRRNESDLRGSSDVYSLGRTFHELLTGYLPETDYSLDPSISSPIRKVLSGMLEQNRDKRIQKIVDVRFRLQEILCSLNAPQQASSVDPDNPQTLLPQISGWFQRLRPNVVVTVTASVVLSVAVILQLQFSFGTAGGSGESNSIWNLNINMGKQGDFQPGSNAPRPAPDAVTQRNPAPDPLPPSAPVMNQSAATPSADTQPTITTPKSRTLPDLEFLRVRMKPFEMGHKDGRQNETAVWVPTASDFWIARSEITQAQWSAIMRTAPWKDFSEVPAMSDAPAVAMTFPEVQQFIDELSRRDSLSYDLPTEPEWEFACLGSASWQSVATPEYAHTRQNSGGRLQSVGRLSKNSLGLYDMLGNAAEWTKDVYRHRWQAPDAFTPAAAGQVYRSVRGGHWNDNPEDCQPWSRTNCDETSRPAKIGIRLVVRSTTSID